MSDKKDITIDDVRPSDRKDGYPTHVPRWFTKLFEAIPGTLTWFFILLPFIAAFSGFPELMVAYITFLTIYWAYRGSLFLIGIYIGYRRMVRDQNTDWIGKIGKEKLAYKDLKYVFICPIVKEDLDVLEPALQAWARSDVDTKKISIVFALEQNFVDISMKNTKYLKEKYGKYFREMMDIVHPNNIEGEIEGVKGANINWASRIFVEMVEERDEKLSDYLLITCDSDLRPTEKYLSAITYKYLTVPTPQRKFFSTAVHTFNNNIYRVPALVRVFSSSISLAIMHEWVLRKYARETWSSYVVNLQTVKDAHFWDPQVPNDDTFFYFNALIRFDGEFSGEEVYVPTHNDAVENETTSKSYQSLYKQQHRWGWGGVVFPITFAGLYKNKKIPLKRKIGITSIMFDSRLIFRTVVYLITLGLPILSLLSTEFQYSSAAYNLPRLMSYIFTFVMLYNLPILFLRRKIMPPHEKWGVLRNIQDIFETLLITVNLLTFAFIPALQAQTEMMFGKGFKKRYYATEKVAIKK